MSLGCNALKKIGTINYDMPTMKKKTNYCLIKLYTFIFYKLFNLFFFFFLIIYSSYYTYVYVI